MDWQFGSWAGRQSRDGALSFFVDIVLLVLAYCCQELLRPLSARARWSETSEVQRRVSRFSLSISFHTCFRMTASSFCASLKSACLASSRADPYSFSLFEPTSICLAWPLCASLPSLWVASPKSLPPSPIVAQILTVQCVPHCSQSCLHSLPALFAGRLCRL